MMIPNEKAISIEVSKKDLLKAMFKLSLTHRMEVDYETAVQYIQAISSYNGFDKTKVIKMLEAIDDIIPRAYYFEGNPNNGNRNYKISIGREGSPVIYVTYSVYGFENNPTHLTKAQIESIKKIAVRIGKADESDAETHETTSPFAYRSVEFRFWWD